MSELVLRPHSCGQDDDDVVGMSRQTHGTPGAQAQSALEGALAGVRNPLI